MWEHSPFHCLAFGTASPLGFTSPPFFAPISCYLISSMLFLQVSLQSLSLALPPQEEVYLQCVSLSVAQVLLQLLQKCPGSPEWTVLSLLGVFFEPALSHPGLLFIVQLFHSSVDKLCFQPCLGIVGSSTRNSSGQGRHGSGCWSTTPRLGQSFMEEAPGRVCELWLLVGISLLCSTAAFHTGEVKALPLLVRCPLCLLAFPVLLRLPE